MSVLPLDQNLHESRGQGVALMPDSTWHTADGQGRFGHGKLLSQLWVSTRLSRGLLCLNPCLARGSGSLESVCGLEVGENLGHPSALTPSDLKESALCEDPQPQVRGAPNQTSSALMSHPLCHQ